MSQTNDSTAVDPTAALAEIDSRVYVPAFMSTLAELGVVPQTQKQAETLCRIGRRLMVEHQNQQIKQAEATGDFITMAADELDRLLGQPVGGPDTMFDDAAVKQAAAACVADPSLVAAAGTVQNAVLALSHRS